ncbi:hypothetical protein [Crossiella sp. CA-258035]|uniref:hypothetical protein n=1 Tax=Crossiella sp. CA-258035 TaxID=2981138 RepID=UPI0032D9D801
MTRRSAASASVASATRSWCRIAISVVRCLRAASHSAAAPAVPTTMAPAVLIASSRTRSPSPPPPKASSRPAAAAAATTVNPITHSRMARVDSTR